jgi:hypothetical protein
MKAMKPGRAIDEWKAVPADVGAIADHFRLPWRFHARLHAGRGRKRA